MTFLYLNEAQCLFIWSKNKKQVGSFINPRKEIFGIKRATFGLVKG